MLFLFETNVPKMFGMSFALLKMSITDFMGKSQTETYILEHRMQINVQDIVMASIGGGMIGVAASILLLSQGRIAGISGIFGSLFKKDVSDKDWRWAFFLGLMAGGLLLALVGPTIVPEGFDVFKVSEQRTMPYMAAAGLLVGFGTQMGNGCTSGHGICGLTRMSPRSMVATITFMIAGFFISTVLNGVLS